jgi:hypothetical protein
MVKFNKFQTSLVKLSGAISVDMLVSEIVAFVNDKIKKLSVDKIDPSLLRFICNVIENSYNKKDVSDSKIDKKKVALDVYLILKPQCNTPDDKILLNNLIEDYHSTKQISKISNLKYYWKLIKKNFISKKD